MSGSASFDQLIHDLRYAGRTLGKNPGFASLWADHEPDWRG